MRTYAYRKVHRPYRGEIDQCADRSLSSSTHGERLDRSFARNIFDVPGTAAGRNRTWSWQRKTRAGKRSEAPFITPGCPVRIRRFGSDGLEPEVNQRSEEAADQHSYDEREHEAPGRLRIEPKLVDSGFHPALVQQRDALLVSVRHPCLLR